MRAVVIGDVLAHYKAEGFSGFIRLISGCHKSTG